ncbi:hypothetical protein GH714_030300 [Hevea brasiliensis]|uniref:U1-type domain-containing protein n=1 Tax=Hevea brasiliensis TaxID=3981 RepID=A0A6A6LC88_HEVBR|nr:hypothetical protein GH714_030300 [Hevea brasiliensis]
MNPAAPAAIAALEQLTQLARSMDAAERAMARLPAKSPGFELVPMLPRAEAEESLITDPLWPKTGQKSDLLQSQFVLLLRDVLRSSYLLLHSAKEKLNKEAFSLVLDCLPGRIGMDLLIHLPWSWVLKGIMKSQSNGGSDKFRLCSELLMDMMVNINTGVVVEGAADHSEGVAGEMMANTKVLPPSSWKGTRSGNARFRSFQAQSVISTSSYTEPSAAKENSADAAKKAAESASAPERIAPNRRPRQIAWCELCRVDCTSLEILEQHKNGKRHKKNLLRIEELKNAIKPADSIQNHPECINDSKPVESQQPPIAEDSEEQKSAENLPSKAGNAEYRMENNLQNNTQEKPEVPMGESSNKQGRKPRTNLFDNRRRGIKRKMKGGRGGKRIKTYETHRRVVEPPKPKVVAPLICDLCNVKCDTREVLDRHLSGKKHIAKFKRFQGHQAIYGPTGLQALYPPNPIGQTHSLPQGHQSFYNPQGSFLAQGGYFPSQGHQSASAAAGLNPRSSQSSTPQQSESTSALDANPANAV